MLSISERRELDRLYERAAASTRQDDLAALGRFLVRHPGAIGRTPVRTRTEHAHSRDVPTTVKENTYL